MLRRFAFSFLCVVALGAAAQTAADEYRAWKEKAVGEYEDFRRECDERYAEFLLTAWEWYRGNAPLPLPKEANPVPPRPYRENEGGSEPVVVEPVVVEPVVPEPQPVPVAPVREDEGARERTVEVEFYGLRCPIRFPAEVDARAGNCTPQALSAAWRELGDAGLNNTIRDCLEARIRYSLCDWAYLGLLDRLSRSVGLDADTATLLMAYLYCQSGYKMRLGVDGGRLCMLVGSKHLIYNKGYVEIDGVKFYPYGDSGRDIMVCNAAYEGEKPASLLIGSEQQLGGATAQGRMAASERYPGVSAGCVVPQQLIDFYNTYPSSEIDGNMMTRWAMYARTPLASATRDALYPQLRRGIEGLDKLEAAQRLLNWVQTGFVYEYDDKVWGHDRAFFAEETLYYPYCDCEDRSILFSRLVRDLLGLDVALVYYPGHLATAVCFDAPVEGDAMLIGGRRFVVCDPTYIGAPVGTQMPELEYGKVQSIVL